MSLKYSFGDPSQFIGAVVNPLADALKKPFDEKRKQLQTERMRANRKAAKKAANPKNTSKGTPQQHGGLHPTQFPPPKSPMEQNAERAKLLKQTGTVGINPHANLTKPL